MKEEVLDTHHKALQINLDPGKYGTFAEIGAGQEVGRWFFRVGGASGTIAKTISAYDMTVSDAIYGASDRYVSRQRLQMMLEYEYRLLLERLAGKRGANTRFFVFADTVTARSYTRQDEAHGWMGVRFQSEPGAEPSQITLHIRMFDRENLLQQEALGIAGVNLLHGALYHLKKPQQLLPSLLDNLNRDRVEIDMIKFDGPAFADVDHRLMSLELVRQRLADCTMFTREGEVVLAAEMLYQKPLIVIRGNFKPITKATVDLIQCAQAQFARELEMPESEVVVLTEMTLRHLAEGGVIDPKEFLDRADTLGLLGLPVMVSSFGRYFRLAAYLLRNTRKRIGIAMGVRRLRELFDKAYYEDLEGGLLEALGRIFKKDLHLFIYPVVENQSLIEARSLQVAPEARHLYAHFLDNQLVKDIQNYHEDYLGIYAAQVLDQIRSGDRHWETAVPASVVGMIKKRHLFGWKDG